MQPDIKLAATLFDSLDRATRQGRGIVRDSYGDGEQAAHDIMRSAAQALGLEVSVDAIGNLMMTLPGRDRQRCRASSSARISTASPQSGNYDGAAGVVAGVCVVSALKECRPTAGLRYHGDGHSRRGILLVQHFLSRQRRRLRAARSRLPRGHRARTTARAWRRRCSSAASIRGRSASDGALLDPARIRAYLELHIEQGPTLVAERLPAAVVTGIRGCKRFRNARCIGQYAHSGAVNRPHRHDAVAATVALLHHLETVWLQQEQTGRRPDDHLWRAVYRLRLPCAQQDCRRHALRHRHPQRCREAIMDAVADEARRAAARIGAAYRVDFDLGATSDSPPAVMDAAAARRLCARSCSSPTKCPAAPGMTRRCSRKSAFRRV